MKTLVVEDDEDSRTLMCTVLEGKGYSVISAPNGRKALQLAKESMPDIIITDILMPEMDGFGLCREIKNDPKLAHIAVVFYTATYTHRADERLALALGASHFILKPQEPQDFIKILEDVIQKYQAQGLPVPQKAKEPSKSLQEWHKEVLINKLQGKIADLKAEKNELFISKEKYRNLIESLNKDFIFYSYDTQRNLTYVSPSVHNILGYTQEEFLTHQGHLLIQKLSEQDAKYNHSHEYAESQYSELEVAHKNGDVHYLDIVEFPVFDNQGKLIAIDGVAQDVTRKKAQQKLLEDARKQMIASEKLASIGQLAAGVSHEILNPLNIISVLTQIHERKAQNDPDLREFCLKLQKEVDRIAKIVNGLLTFSRKENPIKTKISIDEIFKGVIDLVEQDFSYNNIFIETFCCETPCEVFVDKIQIRQALVNLFNNAKQAMPLGGVLSVACRKTHKKNGEFIRIKVSDTGMGIKEENLHKVFDPFFTTKPEGQGTGMGLAVIHGIIHEHSGTINVASEEGKGTTFTIDLPTSP